MSRIESATRGASTGDVLIFLATLSIAAALLYPAWSMRGFRASVENAITDVEALSDAARSERDRQNRWPTRAALGEPPPELAALGGDNGIFSRVEYTLGWTSWEVVDSIEAPPPLDELAVGDAPLESEEPPMQPVVRRIGAVTVYSANEALLAELQEHYTDRTSFVFDSLWLLILPERGEAPPPRL
jgi:hypothetical protein